VIDKDKSSWPLAPYKRRVAHVEFSNLKTDGDTAEFDEKLTWMNGDVQLLDELRHYRVRALGDGQYFLDFSFQLRATYGDVTITRDVSHYAIPYIRMNDTFNVEKGGGKIVNSEGGINQAGTNNRPGRLGRLLGAARRPTRLGGPGVHDPPRQATATSLADP
jgi:hypothetical protein